jgi:hypothetical protein
MVGGEHDRGDAIEYRQVDQSPCSMVVGVVSQ